MFKNNIKYFGDVLLITFAFLSIASYTVDVMSGMMSNLDYGSKFAFIPQIRMLFLIICTGYIVANVNYIFRTSFLRTFIWLCIYSSIITVFLRGISSLSIFAAIWIPFITYLFGQILGGLQQYRRYLNMCFIILFGIVLFYYFTTSSVIYSTFDVNLNIVYVPLLCFLFTLFIDNKYIKFTFCIVILAVLFQSGKRAGLLAIALSVLCVFVLSQKMRSTRNTILFICLVILPLFIFQDQISTFLIENRTISRFSDNDGHDISSGRFEIYIKTLQMYCRSSPLKMLFGHGFGAVEIYSPLKLSAHNDFLEILFDYGLLGLLLYLRIHLILIRRMFKSYDRDINDSIIITFVYVCFFTLSMVSQVYNYPYFYLITMALGFYDGKFYGTGYRINRTY